MSKVNNRRKRVALAGFGVVGGGVYERLQSRPDQFEIAAILSRDPERRVAAGGPAGLLTDDPSRLEDCDILVEAMGGLEVAGPIVLNALQSGADVVTANKTLVARRYDELEEAAKSGGGAFLYSAAVGGGVPMLESLEALPSGEEVLSLAAVLNGTTNFVLDEIAAGRSRREAIRRAQEAGFAEADPAADIDGLDAAEKLSILARTAFGSAIDPDAIPRKPLNSIDEATIVAANAAGAPIRQIASIRLAGRGIDCDIRLRPAAAGSALARPRREENCLVAELKSGRRLVLLGKGAGRDPTARSVLSDIVRLISAGRGARPRPKTAPALNGMSTV